jgi:CheY-like chemotaxis protein
VHIARQQCPDIMLLDANMSDGGIDTARKIKTLRPSVKTQGAEVRLTRFSA